MFISCGTYSRGNFPMHCPCTHPHSDPRLQGVSWVMWLPSNSGTRAVGAACSWGRASGVCPK